MSIEFSNEDMEILEANVNFVGYKRTIAVDYQSITREMSVTKPDNISLQQCNDYVRNQVNYQLQRDLYMLQNKKFTMQGYKGD